MPYFMSSSSAPPSTPFYNAQIFDTDYINTAISDASSNHPTYLTQAMADGLYLQYPSSQGGEQIMGNLIVTNGYINIDTSGYGLLFPDGTAQTSAAQPVHGMIGMYAGLACPGGYLWCDGSNYSVYTYPNLYSAIGSTYNNSSTPSSYFRVPDMRNYFPMGNQVSTQAGTTTYSGSVYASSVVNSGNRQISTNQTPNHTHSFVSGQAVTTVTANSSNNTTVGGGASRITGVSYTSDTATSGVVYGTASQADYLPPFCCVNFIIKT